MWIVVWANGVDTFNSAYLIEKRCHGIFEAWGVEAFFAFEDHCCREAGFVGVCFFKEFLNFARFATWQYKVGAEVTLHCARNCSNDEKEGNPNSENNNAATAHAKPGKGTQHEGPFEEELVTGYGIRH